MNSVGPLIRQLPLFDVAVSGINTPSPLCLLCNFLVLVPLSACRAVVSCQCRGPLRLVADWGRLQQKLADSEFWATNLHHLAADSSHLQQLIPSMTRARSQWLAAGQCTKCTPNAHYAIFLLLPAVPLFPLSALPCSFRLSASLTCPLTLACTNEWRSLSLSLAPSPCSSWPLSFLPSTGVLAPRRSATDRP